MPDREPQTIRSQFIRVIILIGVLPLIFPLLALALIWVLIYFAYGMLLHTMIWLAWCSQGQHVLFVYSNSPNWQGYIEAEILPKLPAGAHVMNWSDRRTWRFASLSVRVFRYFAGEKEFNPMAIVFRRFRWGRTYRFWKPFRDYKHGKTEPLAKLQQDFFAVVGATPST